MKNGGEADDNDVLWLGAVSLESAVEEVMGGGEVPHEGATEDDPANGDEGGEKKPPKDPP